MERYHRLYNADFFGEEIVERRTAFLQTLRLARQRNWAEPIERLDITHNNISWYLVNKLYTDPTEGTQASIAIPH